MITLQEISDTISGAWHNSSNSVKSKGKYWIVFTGDSITSCEWVHPNWREIVEYVVKEELTVFLGDWKTSEWGIRTFNFGYDGATTKNILEKVDDINLVNPDLVIGLMGGNDPTFKIEVSKHVENIKKIIDSLNTKVVWCTSTPAAKGYSKNQEYEPYAKACMQIPQSERLTMIDMFNLYKEFPTEKFFTFTSEENPIENVKKGDLDLVHPNQLGNAYIAKVILKEVFGIDFDPEKYWKDTLVGEKYPEY